MGYWAGLVEADTSAVLFDMEFALSYVSENTVLESADVRDNGNPVLLVQGNFSKDAHVTIAASKEQPDGKLYQILQEAWAVNVSEPEQVTALRYGIPAEVDAERMEILVLDNSGAWRSVGYKVSGSYAVFAFGASDVGFAVLTHPSPMPVFAVLGLGVILLLQQHRDKLKRKKK